MKRRPAVARKGRWWWVPIVAGGLLTVVVPPASAHSFLVGTAPAQGQRLVAGPEAVVLDFSETIDPATVELQVRTAGGTPVDITAPELVDSGLAIRSSLPNLGDGIYVVSWQAFSDVDGHGTFGEHSFAVGAMGGSLPPASASSGSGLRATAATWLFFAGFALAAGALVIQWLEGKAVVRGRRPVRGGLLVASAGALLAWVDGPPTDASGRFILGAVTVGAVMTAVSIHAVARRPVAPLLVLLAGAASWSARGHAAAAAGVVGGSVDFVHLAAGGIWVGALSIVAVRLWRAPRRPDAWVAVVQPYSRLALVLVLVLAGAGVVSAFQLVPTWSSLWSTGYGQLLVVKSVLFLVALVLAGVGRWGGMARRRLAFLRRSTMAEVGVVVCVMVVAGLLVNVAPPLPTAAAEALLGAPPLEGAVARDAGLAGQLNVEVASDGDRLDIEVFSPSGPVPGTAVDVALRDPSGTEIDLVPRPCGPGCVTQELPLEEGTTEVEVSVSAPVWTGGSYRAALDWPPGPEAASRLDELVATTRAVARLTVAETVSSGPGSVVNEVSFQMSGSDLIAAEPYAGGNVTDVRALPGEPRRLSLYVPGSQIFAVLVLDEQGRMVSSRLISPGHEITRRFTYPEV